MTMELNCHCGNIRLSVEQAPETLTSCNCSICNRYGAQWGYYAPEQVEIAAAEDAAVSYRWGDGYLDFMHCTVCGCVMHYITTDKASEAKVGINFRMAPLADVRPIQVRHFDGADTWKFLDE